MPIGGSQLVKADIRIIAATNRKIEEMVKEENSGPSILSTSCFTSKHSAATRAT